MKKRYWLAIAFGALFAIGVGAQNGFLSGAYFINPTVLGTIPECSQFSGGLCVYSPSGLVDNGTILTYKGTQIAPSVGTVVVTGSGTYTTATSDIFTVTGATSSSHCTFSPTNVTASADLLADFISTKATNAITITHSATTASGGTVDILCTVN